VEISEIRNQRNRIISGETIPEKRSYSAWNIESQILTPKREVTHIFSSKSVLFVGYHWSPEETTALFVCTKYKIRKSN